MERRIRVLIVDDSAIVRKVLSDALAAEPDIEVVGTAPDPIVARGKLDRLQVDVLTLDIEMPRMDGLAFLRELMKNRPMPVVMISSLAQSSCAVAMEAMEAGAVEVLGKPSGPYSVGDLRQVLAHKIRSAARARIHPKVQNQPSAPLSKPSLPFVAANSAAVIAIGASTGGTEAIREVLESLPAECPPIVVVQHIPPVFSRAFADRLDQKCRMRVLEACDGDFLSPGLALVAPGDQHMVVRRSAGRLRVEVKAGPRVCYQRPSVDVLFHSVAGTAGEHAVGVLLTGMGSDGAQGLLQMREAGAHTIAQDERSCVVYGMPREAYKLGAVCEVASLPRVADSIQTALSGVHPRR